MANTTGQLGTTYSQLGGIVLGTSDYYYYIQFGIASVYIDNPNLSRYRAYAQSRAVIFASVVRVSAQAQTAILAAAVSHIYSRVVFSNTAVPVDVSSNFVRTIVTTTLPSVQLTRNFVRVIYNRASFSHAQSQALIVKSTWWAQAEAWIDSTYYIGVSGVAQSEAWILSSPQGYGQSLANILTSYKGDGQAQSLIVHTYPNGDIGDPENPEPFAQAEAYIFVWAINKSYSQAEAQILTSYLASGQADSYIWSFENKVEARAIAWTVYKQETGETIWPWFGQAQAHVLVYDVQAYAQAGVSLGLPEVVYLFRDTFSRTVSNGWGQPDVGSGYTILSQGSTVNSVSGGKGLVTIAAGDWWDAIEFKFGGENLYEFELYFEIKSSAVDDPTTELYNTIIVRDQPANEWWNSGAEISTQTNQLEVDSVYHSQASTYVYPTIDTKVVNAYRIKAQGNTVYVKVWALSGSEPPAWQVTYVLTGIEDNKPGHIYWYFEADHNSNVTNPLIIEIDNISVTGMGTVPANLGRGQAQAQILSYGGGDPPRNQSYAQAFASINEAKQLGSARAAIANTNWMLYDNIVANDSPSAYYTFDNPTSATLIDKLGAYTLPYNSGAAGNVQVDGPVAPIGKGIRFATSGYYYSSATNGTALRDNGWALEYWIKPNNPSSNFAIRLYNGDAYGATIYLGLGDLTGWEIAHPPPNNIPNWNATPAAGNWIYATYNHYDPTFSNWSTKYVKTSGPVDTNAWHHVVATLSSDGSTLSLYVDGVLAESAVISPYVKYSWTGRYHYFNLANNRIPEVQLDEFVIYNHPISELRIKDHYSLVTTGKNYPTKFVSATSMAYTIYQQETGEDIWLQYAQANVDIKQTYPIADTNIGPMAQARVFIRKLIASGQAKTKIMVSDVYGLKVVADGASHLYGLHTSDNSNYYWPDEIGLISPSSFYSSSAYAFSSPIGKERIGLNMGYYREYRFWQGASKLPEFAGNTWSIDAWVQSPTGSPSRSNIFSLSDGASTSVHYVDLFFGEVTGAAGTKVVVGIGDRNTYTYYDTGIIYTTSTWYHMAITYNNKVFKVYINGQLTNTITRSGWLTSQSSFQLSIGAYGWYYGYNATYNYYASYDNIAIYPVELSQASIMNHYLSTGLVYAQAGFLYARGFGVAQAGFYYTSEKYIRREEGQAEALIIGVVKASAQALANIKQTYPGGLVSYESIVVADTPIAYWRLSELSGTTAVARMGAYNGTYYNSPSLGQGSYQADFNPAVGFNLSGAASQSMQASALLNFGGGSFTIELWAYIKGGGSFPLLIDKGNGSTGTWLVYYYTPSGTINFKANGTDGAVGTSGVSLNAWHHIVITYTLSGYALKMYVDGNLVSQNSVNVGTFNTSTTVKIGTGTDSGTNWLNGYIDEVALYNYPLTPNQVTRHFTYMSLSLPIGQARVSIGSFQYANARAKIYLADRTGWGQSMVQIGAFRHAQAIVQIAYQMEGYRKTVLDYKPIVYYPLDEISYGGATYTASSYYNTSYLPRLAADGNTGTDWASSGYAYGQYWQVTWDTPQTFTRVKLTNRNSPESMGFGRILLSDGTYIVVTYPSSSLEVAEFNIDANNVTWMRIISDTGGYTNPGFAEIEVYNASSVVNLVRFPIGMGQEIDKVIHTLVGRGNATWSGVGAYFGMPAALPTAGTSIFWNEGGGGGAGQINAYKVVAPNIGSDYGWIPQTVGNAATFAFWMYWDGTEDVEAFVLGINGASSQGFYFYGGNFGFNTGSGDIYGLSSAGIANKWLHIAVVWYSGQDAAIANKIYINGVSQALAQMRMTRSTKNLGQDVWLGFNTYGWRGGLDEFAIFNRELTAPEILDIYSSHVGFSYAQSQANIIFGTIERQLGQAEVWTLRPYKKLAQAQAVIYKTPYEKGVVLSRPSSYYHLDEASGTVLDANRNTIIDGTISGTVTTQQSSLVSGGNYSYYFNGGYVTLGDQYDFINRSAFTWEAWIYPTVYDANWRRIMSKEKLDNPRSGFFVLMHSSYGLWVERWTNGNQTGMYSYFPVSINNTYYMAVGYDGTNIFLFINGVLRQSVDTTNMPDIGHEFRLAAESGTDTNARFRGNLDEVAIYRRALSFDEMMDHYSRGLGLTSSVRSAQAQVYVSPSFNQNGYAQAQVRTLDSSRYGSAVEVDTPVTFFRLKESTGTVVHDQTSTQVGSYGSTALLNQESTIGAPNNPDTRSVYLNAGANSYIYNPEGPISDIFTLELWAKSNNNTIEIDVESSSSTLGTGGERYIWRPSNMGGASGIGVALGTNGIAIYEHGSNHMPAISVYAVSLGTAWHHIVVTINKSTREAKIFLDGSWVHTGQTSINRTLYSPEYIGISEYGNWAGYVAEPAIYNYVLSNARILAHYWAGMSGQGHAQAQAKLNAYEQKVEARAQAQIGHLHSGNAQAYLNSFDYPQRGLATSLITRPGEGLVRMIWTGEYTPYPEYITSWGIESAPDQIYYDDGTGPPGYPGSNAGAAWSARFVAPTTDTWTFRTISDDNSEVSINGTVVVANYDSSFYSGGHGDRDITGTPIVLTEGQEYNLHVRWTQGGGPYTIHVYYKKSLDPSWSLLTNNNPPWNRVNRAYAQARVVTLPPPHKYEVGQAEAQITGRDRGYSQAEARLIGHPRAYGLALAQIGHQQFGLALADIKQTYTRYSQAMVWIGHFQYGLSKAQILVLGGGDPPRNQSYAQAQFYVLPLTGIGFAQARLIAFNVNRYAVAKARIIAFDVNRFGQACVLIIRAVVGQSQSRIKQTYPLFHLNNYALSSLGATVTALPDELTVPNPSDPNFGAAINTIDGMSYTLWDSLVIEAPEEEADYTTLEIDLNDTHKTITGYYILPNKYNVTVALQYRTNINWTTVETIYFPINIFTPLSSLNAISGFIAPPVTARWWRLRVLNGGDGDRISIATFGVGVGSIQSGTFAQAMAMFGHFAIAQAAYYISPAFDQNVYGQAQADIVQTYQIYGQSEAWLIPPTQWSQALAQIIQTYALDSNAMAWIIPPTQWSQALATIKAYDIEAYGFAKAHILGHYARFGNARTHVTKPLGHAHAAVRIFRANYNARGGAIAYIGHFHFAQAGAFIVLSMAYSNTQAQIKTDYIKFAQAMVSVQRFDKWGLARARILQDYRVYSQANVVLNQSWGIALTNSRIHRTYYRPANARTWVEATYQSMGQANIWVRMARTKSYSQAETFIVKTITKSAQAKVQIGGFQYAQASTRMLAFNVPKFGLSACYILANKDVLPPIPTSGNATYLVQYNDQLLPGYAQSEAYDSLANIATHYAAYMNSSLSEYIGLQNKAIDITMLVWEPSYLLCKLKTQEAATILRGVRRRFAKLYIQRRDRYYLAIPQKMIISKSVPTSSQTLTYDVTFEAKPWIVDNTLNTISTGTLDTGSRSLNSGGWTPTTIIVSGTDITISGITETGQDTGSVSISGTVTNFVIDSDNFTSSDNSVIIPKNYGIYVGPGKTIFTITGATDYTIQWQNRYYL